MKDICLEVKKLSYSYRNGGGETPIFIDTDFLLESGEMCTIIGRSGLGKSTFLKLVSGIEKPKSGNVFINDLDIYNIEAKEINWLRRNKIGFVFQHFNLIERLTVYENIELPLSFNKITVAERKKRVKEIISSIGLIGKENSIVASLSGGEKQRVAVGRSVVHQPSIVFADEPTGALDEENEYKIIELFDNLNKMYGIAFLIVTHNQAVVKHYKNSYTIDNYRVLKK